MKHIIGDINKVNIVPWNLLKLMCKYVIKFNDPMVDGNVPVKLLWYK